MTVYELSRAFWDFSFENPEKVCPNHSALYFFAVEHCNRLGWKQKFGLPTGMAKEAIGIKSYNTYKKTLQDLVEFGFIDMIELSRNQYSANIIALSNFDKAPNKANENALSNFDKALLKHGTKHSESTRQSIDSINKPIYNITSIQEGKILAFFDGRTDEEIDLLLAKAKYGVMPDLTELKQENLLIPTFTQVKEYFATQNPGNSNYVKNFANATDFFDHYESNGWMVGQVKMENWRAAARKWVRNNDRFAKDSKSTTPDTKIKISL